MRQYSELERRLLNEFQRDLPLSPTPYADIAKQLGVDEATVLENFERLQREGVISRVGAVFRPNRVGASTLAAMAVPPRELQAVADIVNKFDEVNHNYERQHRFNLWFVVTATDNERLRQVLQMIEQHSGYAVLNLPMQADYFIDLGFDLQWA